MASSTAQDAVDYANEAQMRVAHDTRILVKRGTINVTTGTADYALADDVIELRSVQDSTGAELSYITILDMLAQKSSAVDATTGGYYTISGTIGFMPTPITAAAYTIFYEARPAVFDSDSALEVSGPAELLVDTLVEQMKLADDGQPELAAAEFAYYQIESVRIRGRARRQNPDRVRTMLG